MLTDLNEELKLAALPPKDFAQGIARLIEYVLSQKQEKESEVETVFTGGSSIGSGTAPSETINSVTQI